MNPETPTLSTEQAFNILVQVTGVHRGTREEHATIELALRTIGSKLFPQEPGGAELSA